LWHLMGALGGWRVDSVDQGTSGSNEDGPEQGTHVPMPAADGHQEGTRRRPEDVLGMCGVRQDIGLPAGEGALGFHRSRNFGTFG
jgi:hypothetical protein